MAEKPLKQSEPKAGGADAPEKCTPGTWTVERGNAGAAHPLFVVSEDGRSLRPWCDADAHLMAAAPDLYAALKQLRATIRPDSRLEGYLVLTVDLDRALPICDAALAKARGETE